MLSATSPGMSSTPVHAPLVLHGDVGKTRYTAVPAGGAALVDQFAGSLHDWSGGTNDAPPPDHVKVWIVVAPANAGEASNGTAPAASKPAAATVRAKVRSLMTPLYCPTTPAVMNRSISRNADRVKPTPCALPGFRSIGRLTRLRLLAATIGILGIVLTLGFAFSGGGARTAVPAAAVVVAVVLFVVGHPRPGTRDAPRR